MLLDALEDDIDEKKSRSNDEEGRGKHDEEARNLS